MIPSHNGLSVTEAVTFPRSGHHWLVDILTVYFGERLVLWQRHTPQPEPENANFIRCLHDQDLSEPIRQDRQYLVQIRDPVDALASRWVEEHRQNDWYKTMREWVRYYAGFMCKWIYTPVPNRAILRYSDLMAAPLDRLCSVVSFMDEEGACDRERLRDVLNQNPPRLFTRQPFQ